MVTEIQKFYNGKFIVYYSDSVITKIIANWIDKTMEVYAGEVLLSKFKARTLDCLVNDHGMPVDEEGTTVFVQDWDTGIYAYDVRLGQLLWHNKRVKCVRVLICCNHKLYAFVDVRRMVVMNPESGEVIRSDTKMNVENYFELPDRRFFYGPKRHNWYVADLETLETIYTFPDKLVNPNGHEVLYIENVAQSDDRLILKGVEGSDPSIDRNFERQIRFEDSI